MAKILRVMDNPERKVMRIITDEGVAVLKEGDYKTIVTKALKEKAEKALEKK